jgi:hypothetical protein
MILAWLLLLVGLTISAVAIYYSVIGLAAIFAAAAIPIYIMGGSLEVAKLVCASWLKANWERAPGFIKGYMLAAIVVLMFITSMGIFGFLSKAHTDQSLVSGDVQSKIAVYDEKIKTAKDNIDANRKALRQMDEAVDQIMGRSQDEKGADKAVGLRRAQQKERARLQSEISAEQKTIARLTEERAPIAADVRKIEAEVGPIKYIAAFVYGDNPDANLLEKAVTWVIILIVIVFDPLAVIMLLAAQMTFQWLRQEKERPAPAYEPDDGPLTDEQIQQLKEMSKPAVEETKSDFDISKHAYLHQPFSHFKDLKPMVYKPEEEKKEDDFEFLAKYEEITPTPTPKEYAVKQDYSAIAEWDASLKEEMAAAPVTADSSAVKVDEPTYQILPELEEESKKKELHDQTGRSTDSQEQGLVYVQNAEQGSSTLWARIANRDQMRPVDRLYKEYSEHEFKNIEVNSEDEPELFEFVTRIRKHGPKFSIYSSEKLEYFASRIYELRKN